MYSLKIGDPRPIPDVKSKGRLIGPKETSKLEVSYVLVYSGTFFLFLCHCFFFAQIKSI